MTLTQTVSEIKKRVVTEEEAKQFALDQFGLLMAYMIDKHYKIVYTDEK